MKKKKVKKPLTPQQIAHAKFLKSMGVLPKQLKERQQAREKGVSLRVDTIDSIRKMYD